MRRFTNACLLLAVLLQQGCSRSSVPPTCVIFLLDASSSIPAEERRKMVDYVNRACELRGPRDQIGVIVFGANAHFEVSVSSQPSHMFGFETSIDASASNIADAINLAATSFPAKARWRIVLVSDGNQTEGDALAAAERAVSEGIAFDVLSIRYSKTDVAIEEVAVPTDLSVAESLVVLVTTRVTNAEEPVDGILRLSHVIDGRAVTFERRAVSLTEGEQEHRFDYPFEPSRSYELEASFLADNSVHDATAVNNKRSAYVASGGDARVLLVVDEQSEDTSPPMRGGDSLASRIREADFKVDLCDIRHWGLTDFSQLQPYGAVILSNLRRSSQESLISDQQIRLLCLNTELNGTGLIMLGGNQSFGAGGWDGSELERAMPVNFVAPSRVGATVLVFLGGSFPNSDYWNKIVVQESLKMHGPQDYCGIIHGRKPVWLWGEGVRQVGGNKDKMMALSRLTYRRLWKIDEALNMACDRLHSTGAGTKRIIVFGSYPGDNTPRQQTLTKLKNAKVEVIWIDMANTPEPLPAPIRVAKYTNGKHHRCTNPKAIPRIVQKSSVFRRDAIYRENVPVQIAEPTHEIASGFEQWFSSVDLLAGTTAKTTSDVRIAMTAEYGDAGLPLLVTGKHGRGRTVAFMSDLNAWPTKPLEQMIRWSMRGEFDEPYFTARATGRVVQVQIPPRPTATAAPSCTAIGSDLEKIDVLLYERGDGGFAGEFQAAATGRFMISVAMADRISRPVYVWVDSSESIAAETNMELLNEIAALKTVDGQRGSMLQLSTGTVALDPFR